MYRIKEEKPSLKQIGKFNKTLLGVLMPLQGNPVRRTNAATGKGSL